MILYVYVRRMVRRLVFMEVMMANFGMWSGRSVDWDWILACNRTLSGLGFTGMGIELSDRGVMTIELSYPMFFLVGGNLTKKWTLKKNFVEPWMKSAEVMPFVKTVISSYFGQVMCHIRDKEVVFADVRTADSEFKTIRRRIGRRGRDHTERSKSETA